MRKRPSDSIDSRFAFWHRVSSKFQQPGSRMATRFLLVTAASVFVAEALIMVFLNSIAPLGLWATVLLDSLLILLITLPALYMWLYRPMVRQIVERDQAQEDVRESDQKLSIHLQNTPVVAIEWNLDFEVIEWNVAAEKVFGFKREEAIGRHAAGLVIPESAREHVDRVWSDLIKNRGGSHSTNDNITKDGRTIVCDWNNTPLVDEFGRVYGVASLVQDITERRRAERALRESQGFIKAVMDNLPVGVAVNSVDPTVTFEYMNANFSKYYRTSPEALSNTDTFWESVYEDSDYREKIKARVLDDCASGDPERMLWEDIPITRKGDQTYYVTAQNIPVQEKKLMISTVQDVTARKRAEEELALKNLVFESSLTANSTADTDGLVTHVNEAFLRIWGYESKEAVVGKAIADMFESEDEAASILAVLNERGQWEGEYKALRGDGTTFDAYSLATVVTNQTGEVIGYQSMVLDITDRKQAEEDLLASEERFRTQMIQSPMVMEIYDIDGLQIEVNKAYEELWGFPASTSVNKFNVLKSKQVEETGLMSYVKRAYAGEAVTVPEYVYDPTGETESGGPGRMRWLSTRIYPLKASSGKVTNIAITHEDITDRKQAEEKLRVNEKKSLAWLENSPVCTKVLDTDFNLTYMSTSGIRGLGIDDVTELYGKPYPFHFYPDSFKKPMVMNLKKAKETGEVIAQEASVVDVEGRKLWYHSTIVPVKDDEGLIDYIMVLSMETTERREAEEALAEEIEISEATINSLPGMFFMYAEDGTFLRWNKNHEVLSGYTAEEMKTMTALDWFREEEREALSKAIGKVFQEGEVRIQATPVFKDGLGPEHEFTARHLEVGGRSYLIGVAIDISEIKRLEELESRAQRLETAGRIAGQVAHDFNNLLGPLMAYPDFIREELPRNHPGLAYLDDIEESARKIADINQQLLSLGRRGHYNQEILNLNAIVHQAVKELRPLPDGVTCQTYLDKTLMNIKGGGAQLHRVIANLLSNAVDALQGIGQISVRTENYYLDEEAGAYARVPIGEYVKLTVSDTGRGIPSDIIQKIFDPFFTSKTTDKQRGSGLGLSVVDAVVKDHNGFVDLNTTAGMGTSFYVYLPATRDLVAANGNEKAVGGRERVLIVDDDEVQRDVSSQILTRLGYEVASVDSGLAAVSYLKENPQDLLILDMVMPPGIDGAETYRQIVEFVPDQKAIIVSGFSESDRVIEAQRLGAGAFVKKPLTRKALDAAVRHELDRQTEISARR